MAEAHDSPDNISVDRMAAGRPATAPHFASLQVIASPGLGGAEIAFERTAEALNRAGHTTTCLLRHGAALHGSISEHLTVRDVPMRNYWDFGSVLQIRSLLKTGQWPVVQTWATRATWLTRAPQGVAHVARIGGHYNLRRFRHADGWIVLTDAFVDWLASNGFPRERIARIDNFVPAISLHAPCPLSRAQLGIPEHALVLLSAGRLIEAKGCHDLIEAFALLTAERRGRPLHLLMIGDGPYLEPLRRLARERGVAERVHFSGWVDQAVAAMPLGDLFVFPSHKEGLGNVILEAWSRRLPVVSTATVGGRHLIADGETGLLVPIADPSALGRTLERALADEGLLAALAQAGHQRFLTRFSEQSTVAAYEDFYARIIRMGPRRRH